MQNEMRPTSSPDAPGRTVAVLYGSETGTAQDFAEMMADKLERLHFHVICCSLNDFDIVKLVSIDVLVVFCSTTGQGEFPKNSLKFWKFLLKKKLPKNLLNHIYFTSFGLGDSSYPKFNWAIKKLHNRILQLGAIEVSKRAESDEQNPQGVDGFYIEFENQLIKNLNARFPLPPGLAPISDDELKLPKHRLTINMRKPKKLTSNSKQTAIERNLSENQLFVGKVKQNARITAQDHFQDVRHVELESNKAMNYYPGDTVSLYPTNSAKEVEYLIESQGWQDIADKQVEIDLLDVKVEGGLVKTLTLRSLLTHHIDLSAVPRRSFFKLLWHFATDEREIDKLKEFASNADPEELYNYTNRPKRTISEVLQEFFSVQIPVEYIFDLFPIIKPRLFSISSLPSASSVELTIAIVDYKTNLKVPRKGLCTTWLKTLQQNDEIVFKIHNNNLKFPASDPIIMVSPGTGIAPMRSLILDKTSNSGFNKDQLFLFTGNRYKSKDYLYGEEFSALAQQDKITLFSSFSRDLIKSYVQDEIYLNDKLIVDLLFNKNATIFVCGSSGKMPKQVRSTIERILNETGGLAMDVAKQYLIHLEFENRYLQETW